MRYLSWHTRTSTAVVAEASCMSATRVLRSAPAHPSGFHSKSIATHGSCARECGGPQDAGSDAGSGTAAGCMHVGQQGDGFQMQGQQDACMHACMHVSQQRERPPDALPSQQSPTCMLALSAPSAPASCDAHVTRYTLMPPADGAAVAGADSWWGGGCRQRRQPRGDVGSMQPLPPCSEGSASTSHHIGTVRIPPSSPHAPGRR